MSFSSQLLYLNSTISTTVPHEKLYTSIKVWTSSMMKDREKEELGIGGFGKLPVDKDMLDIDYDAEDNEPLENKMARMSQLKLKNRITRAQRGVNDCVKTNSDQMESDQPGDENSMDYSDQSEFSDEYYTRSCVK
ncbi:hypothetical protein CTI12_AA579990 [Artemisia annua]|uniref:Uncharacterized protein n=1 Tax=Artemisia annua TaxID=35608 RepID=A0A2U1KP89_ARTAN|nr:hypothetical protein CTI12_AA579990 [Artemisia annua]